MCFIWSHLLGVFRERMSLRHLLPLFGLHCPQLEQLSSAPEPCQAPQSALPRELVRNWRGWLLCQSLPAVLPQCRGCDMAGAAGFCWAALGSTAQQKLMDFHCDFFTLCRLFLSRVGPCRSCVKPATAGV